MLIAFEPLHLCVCVRECVSVQLLVSSMFNSSDVVGGDGGGCVIFFCSSTQISLFTQLCGKKVERSLLNDVLY